MQPLIDNARRLPAHVARNRAHYARLAEGQQPSTLFISCSDSRVVPSLITGARPGEVFELRTAGNIVPSYRPRAACAVAGTLQFAVEVLRIPDIVVCGHSRCGAVQALSDGRRAAATLPMLHNWLGRADFRASRQRGDGSRLTLVEHLPLNAEQQHLLRQVDHLRTYPWVADRVARGNLRLHPWFYTIDTGEVTTYRSQDRAFGPL